MGLIRRVTDAEGAEAWELTPLGADAVAALVLYDDDDDDDMHPDT
jgi:hypothetical protein